tara:strand:- start:1912 stop:2232 length:321 start_codon:yes stop_codon:yes gene_type:complete
MLEFLKTLTILQWVLLGGGACLIFPVVRDFLGKIRNTPKLPVKTVTDSPDLTSIVHKWEVLYDACASAGLEEARAKLYEVFPMFAKTPTLVDPPDKNNTVPEGGNE